MRVLIQWGRAGAAAWLSHLDIQRAMQRALRRAGLPVAWSQGFNPHVALSFASALSVGVSSDAEVLDLGMAERTPVLARLNAALPPGFAAYEERWVSDAFPSPMAIVTAMDIAAQGCHESLLARVPELLAAPEVMAEKKGKKGIKRVDIRPLILSLDVRGDALIMRLRHGSAASVKPESVLAALAEKAGHAVADGGASPSFRRTALWTGPEDQLMPLMQHVDPGDA